MLNVLMVCLGNICRSPMAQAVAQHQANLAAPIKGQPWVKFHSAGTHPGFVGELPDPRARAALEKRGYPSPTTKSRRISELDFESSHLILAMDNTNLAHLLSRCPEQHQGKIRLFLSYAEGLDGQEVPDPYYGDARGFERVLDMCEAAARGLIPALGRSAGETWRA